MDVPCSLEERLARLERSNRRWRRGTLLSFFAASATIALGMTQRHYGCITTEQICFVDAAGNQRGSIGPTGPGASYEVRINNVADSSYASLGIGEAGNPSLRLHHPGSVALLSTYGRGAKLEMGTGQRLRMGYHENNGPSLTMTDPQSRSRIELQQSNTDWVFRRCGLNGNGTIEIHRVPLSP